MTLEILFGKTHHFKRQPHRVLSQEMQEVRYALSTLERILAENGQDGAKKAWAGPGGLNNVAMETTERHAGSRDWQNTCLIKS